MIKENLIIISNYFAINYFANFLSQNFWSKILLISSRRLACGYIHWWFCKKSKNILFCHSGSRPLGGVTACYEIIIS
jgi:hypothetical protein